MEGEQDRDQGEVEGVESMGELREELAAEPRDSTEGERDFQFVDAVLLV